MIDCTKCIYFELEGIEGVCKHFGMVIDDAEPCSCTAFTKEENNLPDRLRFRFWHKPTEKMVDCYGYNPDFVFGDTLDGIGTEYNPAKFEDCILMQCTGLKDKNGKLIFEGDILKETYVSEGETYTEITFVDFDIELSAYCFRYDKENKVKPAYVFELNKGEEESNFEVIGNIYENPELLKGEFNE